jgi:hypothetical protein
VKAIGPIDSTNHRRELERQFRNQDHLKDERFDAVLTHKAGADEIQDVCPICSPAISYPQQKF